jgi:hypothetical protein
VQAGHKFCHVTIITRHGAENAYMDSMALLVAHTTQPHAATTWVPVALGLEITYNGWWWAHATNKLHPVTHAANIFDRQLRQRG